MRTFKIALLSFTLSGILACNNGNVKLPFVSRDTFEAAENKNKELAESLQNVQESYARQNKELNSILAELSSISYKTTQLHINLEGTQDQQTQADIISENIDALKSRIDKLEKEAARARKIDKNLALATKTIKELRLTIASQEKEISILKATIADNDVTIRGQKKTIDVQDSTILSQKQELARTVARQTEMIFKAGVEFERIADDGDFTISGKKNKRTVKEYRTSIYQKAIESYRMAASQGYAGAKERIDVVNAKIDALK